MAVLSLAKGLYHWAVVCGFTGPADGFEYQPTPWQTATIFFAVIDLVAAVGLWLAAAWGAVLAAREGIVTPILIGRADAIRALARALRTARIHGVTTNRDLLVRILDDAEFRAGCDNP